jgi:hypothetical protein
MNIDLSKQDLLNLVLGTSPHYDVFENHRIKSAGKYIGGFKEEWQWDRSKLELLPEQELYQLYRICQNSWAFYAIDKFEREHHSCPACGKELTFDVHQNMINGLKT